MNVGWVLGSAVASFAIAALFGKWLVPFLKKVHFGQTILEDGPKWHEKSRVRRLWAGSCSFWVR